MKLTTLFEAKMSPSTLAKQFEKIDGSIGFEIECLLSKHLVAGNRFDYDYDYGDDGDDEARQAYRDSFDSILDDEESEQDEHIKYYQPLREILEEAGLYDYVKNLDYDSSIKPFYTTGCFTVEIVTIPINNKEALLVLRQIFDLLKDYGMVTNDSCGLHINVSTNKTSTNNTDLFKLMMFLGEDYLLSMFDRENNVYTRNMKKELLDTEFNKASYTEMNKIIMQRIGEFGKYYSFNTNKLSLNYIEFRVAGGANYQYRMKEITNTTHMFMYVLYIADNKDYLASLYAKKKAAFISKLKTEVKDDPVFSVIMKIKDVLPVASSLLPSNQPQTEYAEKDLKLTCIFLAQIHEQSKLSTLKLTVDERHSWLEYLNVGLRHGYFNNIFDGKGRDHPMWNYLTGLQTELRKSDRQ